MKRWVKLFAFLMGIWLFIVGMPRLLGTIRIYSEIIQKANEKNIEVNAVFYSEEPMSYKAEKELREKIQH
jgi:hypothetical protein